MKNKNIIVMGPQGSGKGTQADILANKLNILHISTGNIFRDHIKNKTKLGKKIIKFVHGGELISDEITNQVVKERLGQNDCQNGFILDGFPRNLVQAKFLEKIVNINLVLEIWISNQESISRISARRSCPKCGKIYHLKFNPPKKEGFCDQCKEKLIIRNDDKPESIKKRLKLYHEETKPLINYYKAKGIYHKINGMPTIPAVTKQITEIFK